MIRTSTKTMVRESPETIWRPLLVNILLLARKETQLTLWQSKKRIYQEDSGTAQELKAEWSELGKNRSGGYPGPLVAGSTLSQCWHVLSPLHSPSLASTQDRMGL